MIVVTAVPTDKNDMDELDKALDVVLETAAERNKDETKVDSIGEFLTEAKCRQCLVEWRSDPHKCLEPILLTECKPPIVVKKGELVCKARRLEELVGEPVEIHTATALQR
jgi:hypothetical protein